MLAGHFLALERRRCCCSSTAFIMPGMPLRTMSLSRNGNDTEASSVAESLRFAVPRRNQVKQARCSPLPRKSRLGSIGPLALRRTAEAMNLKYPRTARVLRPIAENYDRMGQFEDNRLTLRVRLGAAPSPPHCGVAAIHEPQGCRTNPALREPALISNWGGPTGWIEALCRA